MSRYNFELKPCPFCGGRAILEESHRGFMNGKTTKITFVRCTVCNARSGRQNIADYGKSSYSRKASEVAVNDWNRRAQ